jgi:hypothetical protein
MAMIPMTTNSSTRVKPSFRARICDLLNCCGAARITTVTGDDDSDDGDCSSANVPDPARNDRRHATRVRVAIAGSHKATHGNPHIDVQDMLPRATSHAARTLVNPTQSFSRR